MIFPSFASAHTCNYSWAIESNTNANTTERWKEGAVHALIAYWTEDDVLVIPVSTFDCWINDIVHMPTIHAECGQPDIRLMREDACVLRATHFLKWCCDMSTLQGVHMFVATSAHHWTFEENENRNVLMGRLLKEKQLLKIVHAQKKISNAI